MRQLISSSLPAEEVDKFLKDIRRRYHRDGDDVSKNKKAKRAAKRESKKKV